MLQKKLFQQLMNWYMNLVACLHYSPLEPSTFINFLHCASAINNVVTNDHATPKYCLLIIKKTFCFSPKIFTYVYNQVLHINSLSVITNHKCLCSQLITTKMPMVKATLTNFNYFKVIDRGWEELYISVSFPFYFFAGVSSSFYLDECKDKKWTYENWNMTHVLISHRSATSRLSMSVTIWWKLTCHILDVTLTTWENYFT